MLKEAIATAPTIAEATQKAKEELNAPFDADVKFEVLQHPQKKMLGLFGGKEARVRAYYDAAEEKKTGDKLSKTQPGEAEEKKSNVPAEQTQKSEPAQPLTPEDDEAIKAYLKSIIVGMGITDVQITSHDEEEETVYELETATNHGALIGRHGETLDSVQYLVRLFANKNTASKRKVSLNVGDYREKRAQSLKEFAKRSASQVLKYGRNVKLDPMNPYERRIIHTAIQGIAGVTSHSVGYDTERRVIITLEEGVQPTHGDRRRGGYNNRRGSGRGGYNNNRRGSGKGGYNRQSGAPSNADRAPRSDSAGSRYGKIEVKKPTEQ